MKRDGFDNRSRRLAARKFRRYRCKLLVREIARLNRSRDTHYRSARAQKRVRNKTAEASFGAGDQRDLSLQ